MRVVNKNKDRYTHYIGRGSDMGNPFTCLPINKTIALVQVGSLDESIEALDEWLRGDRRWSHVAPDRRKKALEAIYSLPEDAILGCYCRPKRCHGDVIVKLWQEMHFDIRRGSFQYKPCPACGMEFGMGLESERGGSVQVVCSRCDYSGPASDQTDLTQKYPLIADKQAFDRWNLLPTHTDGA